MTTLLNCSDMGFGSPQTLPPVICNFCPLSSMYITDKLATILSDELTVAMDFLGEDDDDDDDDYDFKKDFIKE